MTNIVDEGSRHRVREGDLVSVRQTVRVSGVSRDGVRIGGGVVRAHRVGDRVRAGGRELAGGVERGQRGHGVALADGNLVVARARVRVRQRRWRRRVEITERLVGPTRLHT